MASKNSSFKNSPDAFLKKLMLSPGLSKVVSSESDELKTNFNEEKIRKSETAVLLKPLPETCIDNSNKHSEVNPFDPKKNQELNHKKDTLFSNHIGAVL